MCHPGTDTAAKAVLPISGGVANAGREQLGLSVQAPLQLNPRTVASLYRRPLQFPLAKELKVRVHNTELAIPRVNPKCGPHIPTERGDRCSAQIVDSHNGSDSRVRALDGRNVGPPR